MQKLAVDDIVRRLQQVPLFAEVEQKALVELAAQCRFRRFGSREYLFHEGDSGNMLYLLLAGHVSIMRISEQGEVLYIAERGPGDHIGELSLIDGKSRSADVVTVEACEALMLNREDFLVWMQSSPVLVRNLVTSLASRLREAIDQVDRLQSQTVMGRVCRMLLELSEQYGKSTDNGHIHLTVKLTQQEMADRVGANRATVNRTLSTLKSMQAITTESGGLTLRRLDRLRRYADS